MNAAYKILFPFILLMAGCVKEGPEGPSGPIGPQGPSGNGNANVEVVLIPNPIPADWTGSNNSGFTTQLATPMITTDDLMSGAVNVYFYTYSSTDTIFRPLPFSMTDPLPIVNYTYLLSQGMVTVQAMITQGFMQNPGIAYPAPDHGFKVVVIH